MMNATLRGKPDAGNLHVRFDEGEVASAKPRRGSLLYKKLIVGISAALCGFAAFASWNVVQESSKWYLSEDVAENGWKFTATVSGTDVSVTGISSTGDSSESNPKVLDFTTINDGYSLVTFKGLGSTGDSPTANAKKVSKIIFPTTITSLGSQAFRGANCIEFDTAFLKNVTKLDNMAFRSCTKLTGDIELDNVTVLGTGVFQSTKITSLKLPETFVKIPASLCSGCSSLASVTVGGDASLKNVTSIGESAFNGCSPMTGDIELDSLTSCGANAFKGTKITSIKLPDDMTAVPTSLCQDCKSLTKVTIGDAVTTVNFSAFYGCSKLTEMNFPKTLSVIGGQAFRDCALSFPAELFPQLTSIAESGFSGCGNLTCDVVLTNCTSIGGTAFKTAKFKSIVFGDGLTTLSAYTFQNGALTNVVFGSGLTSISANAFPGCSSIRQYYFANYPTLASGWITKPKTGTGVRAFVPKADATWLSKMTAATFTKWADCTDANKTAYYTAFGEDAEQPTGYTTDPLAMWLIAYGGGEKEVVQLRIEGDPEEYGKGKGAVTPDYGDYDVSTNLPLAVSALTYYADGLTLRKCTGYTMETYDDATMEWKNPQSSSDLSFTYDPKESVYNRVTWHWTAAGHQIGFGDLPEGTSVTAEPQPDVEGYYKPGTVVTLTAVGDGFVRWYGDGIDEATASNRTQTVTVDGEKNMVPYFVRNWTYADGKVTDGYWTFKATLSGTKITIGKPAIKSVVSYVDFTKPVDDGYVFAGVADSAFYGLSSPVTEMRLPKTIESVGGQAFRDATFKVNIDFFEGVQKLYSSAFTDNDGLDGDVRLLSATTLGEYAFNRTSKVRSMEFGEGVVKVPVGFCQGCGSLTNAVFGSAVESVGASAFLKCSSLREYRFATYPTFATGWASSAKKGTGVRAFVERESWAPIFASNQVFTAWADCTAAQTNDYFTAFGENAQRPRGYTTYPLEMWLIPYSPDSGLMIFVR